MAHRQATQIICNSCGQPRYAVGSPQIARRTLQGMGYTVERPSKGKRLDYCRVCSEERDAQFGNEAARNSG